MDFRLTDDQDLLGATWDSRRARRYTDDVEWSGMDASRTEPDFLFRCIESAIRAGASTINIPDTVGYAYPEEFADLIREIKNNVPNIDKAIKIGRAHV